MNQEQVIYRMLAQAIAGHPADLSAFPEEATLRLAIANGSSPLLGSRLSEGSVTGLSDKAIQDLNEYSKSLAMQDLILNNDTRKLLGLLAHNDIPALLLKGTALSLLAFEKPYLRVRCDTDLYIRECDVERIAQLLEANGYTIHNLGTRTHASKQFQASIRTFQQIQSTFDIHYRLSNRVLFQNTLPFDECWQEKQPVPELGPQAWALSNRDLLVHACIHRIAHGRGTERNRLIWLYDIHLLWQGMDEAQKEAFIQKALAKQIGALSADALKTADDLFVRAASAATLSYKELRRNRKKEPTAPLINASKPRWAMADLMATKGLDAKLGFISEVLWKKKLP